MDLSLSENQLLEVELIDGELKPIEVDGCILVQSINADASESNIFLDTEISKDGEYLDAGFAEYIVGGGGGCNCGPGGPGSGSADIRYTNPAVAQNVGNVKIGEAFNNETIQQVLDRIFAPSYTKPAISIGLSCKSLYDKDVDTLTSVTISANVTKTFEKIAYVKFYVGSTLVETLTTGVEDGGVFKYTYTPATPINSTTSFKVEACDVTTKTVVTSTAYTTFVQKSYWGVVPSILDATDPDVFTVLTNGLKTSVSMTQKFTTEFGRFVFAYPTAIGTVKSIKDNVNNFNYTDSCSRASATVNGGTYEVVYLTECAGFDDVAITFA